MKKKLVLSDLEKSMLKKISTIPTVYNLKYNGKSYTIILMQDKK